MKHIVVTGCSHSTGMEMNDHLLGNAKTYYERDVRIIEWYKKNFTITNQTKNINALIDVARECWHELERKKSWVFYLPNSVNLSCVGASVGMSYVNFQNFLKCKPNFDGIVIHQIPSLHRLYLKFNSKYGRINMIPNSSNLMYNKKYYEKEIKFIKDKYKKIISNGLEQKINRRIILRLNNMYEKSFYIFNNIRNVPQFIPREKIIIDNLDEVRASFPVGKFGHNITQDYNRYIIDKVQSIL